MSDLHINEKVESGTVQNDDNKLSEEEFNKTESVYFKSDVIIVAHTIDGVHNNVAQKRIQTIRFADDTFDNSSLNEDNHETDSVHLNRHNNIYSAPSLKRESITNFCWWDGCFPMHSCQICTDPDPEFWNCYLRIVLIILFSMLLATAGFLFYVTFTPEIAKSLHSNFVLIIFVAVIALLSLNYIILSYVAESACYFYINYFVLFIVVAVYAIFLGALSARLETEAFLYAVLTTAAIVFALFVITWCPCFCFSRWGIVLPVSLAVAMGSGFFTHLLLSNFYAKSYPTRHLLLIGTLVLVHAIVISFEISRLLCSNCLDPYCLDYGLGAYLLYTMFLQIFFYWLYLIFSCVMCYSEC